MAERSTNVGAESKIMATDSTRVMDELRNKLKSKMEVAKFFSAFISLVIGILLKNGTMTSRWSKSGVVFFLFSLGFCVAAISAYDHLLTPRKYLVEKYWADLSGNPRLEELFQERLATHMFYSWRFLFVPTLVCFGMGFSLVLVQELRPLRLDVWFGIASGYFLATLLVMAFLAPTVVLFSLWRIRKWSLQ